MAVEILFTKASGAGNDFVIIDNRNNFLPDDKSSLAQRLCSRNFGVGADGLLLLEVSHSTHFAMRYFNSDGSYGGMCGNGGRCIARFAFLQGIAPSSMSFESLDFVYSAEVNGHTVVLSMKDPGDFRVEATLPMDTWSHEYRFVNTGAPHTVCFVDDVDLVPVDRLGPGIRNAPAFLPDGTNVDFVQVSPDGSVRLRTYERGVEAETLACGTGAVAAGVVAHLQRGLQFPVKVRVKSGESLLVNALVVRGTVTSPTLEGSAHMLFGGRVLYDPAARMITEPEQKDVGIT